MSFNAPIMLLLLFFLPVIGIFLLWRENIRRQHFIQLGDKALISQLSNQHKGRKTQKWAVWFLALVLLIIASARPTWGVTDAISEVDNMAVILILDISHSMDAEDTSPSRLERAKLIARSLFENAPNTFFGLVLFAGDAFVRLPLTPDTSSAITFLEAVNSDAITQQGTNLALALDVALSVRDERIAPTTIFIILSDGEAHDGNIMASLERTQQAGIIIHAIGVGTVNGAEIPIRDATGQVIGNKTDAFGNVVTTRLEEALLKQLAEATGGIYQRGTETGAEINIVLSEITQLRQNLVQVQIQSRSAERYNIFILLAIGFLLLETLIPAGRKRHFS